LLVFFALTIDEEESLLLLYSSLLSVFRIYW